VQGVTSWLVAGLYSLHCCCCCCCCCYLCCCRWQAPASGTVKATTCGYTKADTMMAVLLGDSPTGPWRCIRFVPGCVCCCLKRGCREGRVKQSACAAGALAARQGAAEGRVEVGSRSGAKEWCSSRKALW
jgi:hypothetical protein